MEAVRHWLRDVLHLAGEIHFAWVEEQLGDFSQALYAWLYDLFTHPTPNWRAGLARFEAEQLAKGRVMIPESRQALVDYLEDWSKRVDWTALNPALADIYAGVRLDGTSVQDKRPFEPPKVNLPALAGEEGPSRLDELLDPELPPLVSSDEDYRRDQLAARGDSPEAMGWIALNQAINRYVWGIEDRHESLETPGERRANNIADTAAAVSDLALGAAGAGKLKGRTASAGKISVRKRGDKSWKKLIEGRAQHTGTKGHAFRTYREAIRMAKSAQYDKIRLNRAYSTTTGTKTTPRRLPDVLARRKSGRFDAVEVPSKTDIDENLMSRNREAMRQLPKEQQGDVRLARPTGSEQ